MPSLNQNIFQIFFQKIKSLDWIILFLIALISFVSLLTLSSLDFNNDNILQKHSYRIIFSFFIFLLLQQ